MQHYAFNINLRVNKKTFMNKYLLLILLSITLFACRQDVDIEENNNTDFPTQTYVNTTVKGIIFNNKEMPVEGAMVIIGENRVKTDMNGYFLMKNIKAKKNGALIKVVKNGFRTETKSFFPQLNSTTFFRFVLHYNKNSVTVDSDSKNKNFGSSFANIKINGNDFIKNNKKYTGKIVINPYWTNIFDLKFKNKLIAAPIGYDKYFNLKGLKSYGIVGLELFDETTKNPIELGEGNYLTLKLKLDNGDSPVANPPESVPVWYFDFDKGTWLEKTKAILDSEKKYYIVEVNRTGFWNFATSFDVKRTEFSLTSKNNIKLPYIKGIISDSKNNYYLDLRSNSDGKYACFLPQNNDVEIKFYLKDKIVKEKINSELSNITINENTNVAKVKADFHNCNDESIKNGYITIITNRDSMFYSFDEKGSINANIILDDNENTISWFATDIDQGTNTYIHKTKIIEREAYIPRAFICEEPYLIFRFGDKKAILNLEDSDCTKYTLYLKYKNKDYDIELGFTDFHGIDNYESWAHTIQVGDNFNHSIIPNLNYSQINEIIECDSTGIVRGHIKTKAIFKNIKTMEVFEKAELEIDYSAKAKQ